MRPCEYPRDVIVSAIDFAEKHIPPPENDNVPFPSTPEAAAKLSFDRGARSVVAKMRETLRSHDREAIEKAKAR